MRILILTISYAPNVGGVETHLADWVRWLRGRPDLDVDVLTYQPITTDATGPAFEQDGCVRIFRVRWFGRTLFHRLESRPALQFLYLAPRLLLAAVVHLLRHGRPDVLHAHGLAAIWVAGWLKRLWKIPVLGALHTVYIFPPETQTGKRIGRVLHSADRVLSCAEAGVIQSRAYGLSEKQVGGFTYWVDQTVFIPHPCDKARRELGLPLATPLCLFVGRLIEVKGVRIILDLARVHPELLFVVAGDGPLDRECAEAEKTLSNLRYLGCRANRDLPLLYSASDVLLVPSLFTEGIPRVICEGLSCGLPVIASDRGGSREALTPGLGRLAEPTEESFSAALREWLASSASDPGLRQRCRRHAEERFSERNAAAIEDCLRQIVAQTSPRG